MLKKHNNKKIIKIDNEAMIKEFQKNIIIKFSIIQIIKLFILEMTCSTFKNCSSKKTKSQQTIIKKGKVIIYKELDILRILKNLRNLKIFNKLLGYDGINKYAIKNSYKNII